MAPNQKRTHGELTLRKERSHARPSEDEDTDDEGDRPRSPSQPRFTQDAPPRLYPPGRQPVTQNLAHHDTASATPKPRGNQAQPQRPPPTQSASPSSGRRPHPLTKLTDLMAGFCGFGASQFGSCASYCNKNPEIWTDTDCDKLPSIAKELLQASEQTTAVQVISRYLILKGAVRDADTRKARVEWISKLGSKPGSDQRRLFESACETLLTQLVNSLSQVSAPSVDQEGPMRHTRGASSLSSGSVAVDTSYDSPRTSTGGRRSSVASKPGGLSTLSPAAETSADTLSSLPKFGRSSSTANNPSDASDIDTTSVLGGKAFAGESGPRDAIVAQWSHDVQDTLRKDFKVYEGRNNIDRVFGVGSMISVFWHEALGSSRSVPPEKLSTLPREPTTQNLGKGFLSKGPKGELIYSHVRRFVIVVQRAGHSIGVPITSYSSKGLTTKKLSEREQRAHAVIYAHPQQPMKLTDEPQFSKDPICVDLRASGETLSPTSRIYYAKPQSIDHNIKIKFLGRVIPIHVPLVIGSFREELLGSSY